jgi:hypothetical protein
MKNLQHLSDVIGPRLTGSAALVRANNWAARVMEGYGLENVKLEPWEIPLGWERGTATLTLKEPTPGRQIPIASWAWKPGNRGKVTGPVVAVTADTRKTLTTTFKGKLKGAVVVWGPPRPVAPVTNMDYLNSRNQAAPPAKADAAPPKKEAPATIIDRGISSPTAEEQAFLAAEGASLWLMQPGKPHGLLTMSGGWGGLDRSAANEGLAQCVTTTEGYGLLWRLATTPDLKVSAESEVTNRFVPGPLVCFNTVGEIRGSEKPDEFVVIGAHLDSWDLGSGTTDNGTGSCVVLECARALGELARQGQRPKRTVRFVLFSGEEQGLYGSKEYVKRHEAEMEKTSVALVHDTGTGKVWGLAAHGQAKAVEVLKPELTALEAVGFKGVSTGVVFGTDHQSFHRAKVPGFAGQQDPDEYRLTHHTQTDTFDKAKEPYLLQGAQVLSVTALRVANLPELLPRQAEAFGGGRPTRREPPKDEKPKDEKPAEKKAG